MTFSIMKQAQRIAIDGRPLMLVALLCLATASLHTQSIVHHWHVADNGGGISSAGGVTLSGSTGQPFVGVANASGVTAGHGYIPGIRSLTGGGSSLAYTANAGWNMISVPVIAADYRKTTIFPGASSNAFAYEGSYQSRDTLQNGTGYWLKFPTSYLGSYSGTPVARETIAVSLNWNMIGSIGAPVPVAAIGSIPGGIVTTNFYGYTDHYFIADTIQTGKAYWVKTNQNGQLVISSSRNVPTTARIRIVPTSERPPSPPTGEPASPGPVLGTQSPVPGEFALRQNFPNPFNPTTVIRYDLPVPSRVRLKIYDMLGREVSTLVDAAEDAGFKSAVWNAGELASGMYFYRIEATAVSGAGRSFTRTRKFLLVK
jgi:hypothetical protein